MPLNISSMDKLGNVIHEDSDSIQYTKNDVDEEIKDITYVATDKNAEKEREETKLRNEMIHRSKKF